MWDTRMVIAMAGVSRRYMLPQDLRRPYLAFVAVALGLDRPAERSLSPSAFSSYYACHLPHSLFPQVGLGEWL